MRRTSAWSGARCATVSSSIARALEPEQGEQVTDMDIKRSGSRSSSEGPTEWFTGKVRVEPLFQASAPGRAQGASVTFEPGARSAWHTHPLGQTLIVTAGRGFVQRWGGPVEEVHPGDLVSGTPGDKH